jgi:hypothetical protein
MALKGGKDGASVIFDEVEGMAVKDVVEGRRINKDAGSVVIPTNDAQVKFALDSDKVDMVIPYHGRSRAEMDRLGYTNYSGSQHERWFDPKAHVGEKPPTITPAMHKNDKATFLKLCDKFGLKPRFSQFKDHPNYMKLVKDYARTDTPQLPIKANWDAREVSIQVRKRVQELLEEKSKIEKYKKEFISR